LIIGEGSEKSNLIKLTKELKLSKNIKFVGYTNNVEKYLNKSKFFVMTSKSEGLPIALIEAMACGVVPIITKVGDMTDIVRKNNSIDFKEQNIRKILNLMNNSKLYQQYSKKAIKSVKSYSKLGVKKIWEDNVLIGSNTK